MDTIDRQEQKSRDVIDYFYLNRDDSSEEWNQKFQPIMMEITYYDADDREGNYKERELFRSIIEMIRSSAQSVTVFVESDHIDASYTDTYYSYFSGLHYEPIKYCKRFSFFQGEVKLKYFLKKEKHEMLQKSLIGTMVIRPLKYGFIGRTLLDPGKVLAFDSKRSVYLRTATFVQHILGVEFTIDAFPFCSQDSSFMTCAEVTILNLMEYYTMRYHAYKRILPSDIKSLSQRYQYERVTPSVGLTYLVVSKILSEFGFSPRIYNRESIMIHSLVGDERENEIKRIMHYYIESGIPVAVNVEPEQGDFREGHSLLCIGHSGEMDLERAKSYAMIGRNEKHAVINSADFYVQYCIVDDHQRPYEIRNYREMSTFSDMKISNLAVPLYKKMYLEAKYAYDIFYRIFRSERLGLARWEIPEEYLSENDTVVMRIYQASSRSYKAFKVAAYDECDLYRKGEFAQLEFPQFIWCCEFFTFAQYVHEDRKAFANIILDATASLKHDYVGSIIAIETVNKLFKKERNYPDNKLIRVSFWKSDGSAENTLLSIYDRNLKNCGG
ncbi:MAG: hypothetical protein K1W20_09760 [Lachnospiraceae bacterium]